LSSNPGAGIRRNFIGVLNERFGAIAGWSYDHRWWVLMGCVALAIGSLALATRARIDNSYEAYFDGFEHGPWNREVMRRISELTTALEEEVPFVYEVTSLANAELLQGAPDGIEIRKLRDDFPETQESLLAQRELYRAKPMLVGGILSADAEYGAIIIEMDRSSTDPLEEIRLDPEGGDGLDNLYPKATFAAIEEILARPEYEGIRFYHSGDVPLNDAYNTIIGGESMFLNLLTLAVITVVFFAFFRSVVGVVAPALVVQLSVIACMGLIGLLGWSLDMSFGSVPTLLTAIGVAHAVHILSEFRARFTELRASRR
jgi:predicted RND superfamily exporter protein